MNIRSKTSKPTPVESELQQQLRGIRANTDRAFCRLGFAQWAFCVGCALTLDPQTWSGERSSVHPHVWAAVLFGGLAAIFPFVLAKRRPGEASTRWVIATSQAVISALVIHVLGGRSEAHFHIFGVLAFLAFYRDKYVYIPMVGLTLLDHLVRGVFLPGSIFGVDEPTVWRSLEHGAWMLFEIAFLVWGIDQNLAHLRQMCRLQQRADSRSDMLEEVIERRTEQLEEAHRQSREQIAAIDRVQGRIEFTPAGNILDVNENLAALMGYSPLELIGKHHRVFVDPELAASPEYAQFWEQLRDGTPQQGDFRRIARDGSERFIYGTYAPMLNEEGNVERVIKYAIDQTARHRLEDQLSRAQKLESIGQLAAGVAHEINTPMQFVGDNIEYLSECSDKLFRVVDSYQSMLDDDEMPSSWRKRRQELEHLTSSVRFDRIRKQVPAAIEESRDGVRRTIEIVRAMKEFSHPGAKEKAGANLNTLVESTVAISRNRWKYAAEIDLQLDPDLPDAPMLASEINQVLLNLIVNAGDAIAEKNEGQEGALGTITVRTHADDDWVSVEVEDDGCGIPKEIQRKVFDPFFTTKDVGKGTGQGLSITHSVVVNQHGGQLSLSSEPGKGAKFSIQLPRHVESEDQDLPGSTIADPAFA